MAWSELAWASASGVNSGTTSPIDTTGANLIVVIHSRYLTTPAFEDSQANTWTALTEQDDDGNRGLLFYCISPSTSATHTFTCSATSGYSSCVVLAFTQGAATTFVAETGGESSGTAAAAGSIGAAGQLVIQGFSYDSTNPDAAAIDGSFSTPRRQAYGAGNNEGSAIAWKEVSGAVNPTWTWSGSAIGCAVAASFTSVAAAALTGTATAAITEADVVAGGKTIIITLANDTFVAAGGAFDAIRQDLIDGFDSAQSESTGWNAEVRDKAAVTEMVRTSATVATWTIAAQAGHNITAQEVITGTIPASALTSGIPTVATPTFTVDPVVVYNFFRGMR